MAAYPPLLLPTASRRVPWPASLASRWARASEVAVKAARLSGFTPPVSSLMIRPSRLATAVPVIPATRSRSACISISSLSSVIQPLPLVSVPGHGVRSPDPGWNAVAASSAPHAGQMPGSEAGAAVAAPAGLAPDEAAPVAAAGPDAPGPGRAARVPPGGKRGPAGRLRASGPAPASSRRRHGPGRTRLCRANGSPIRDTGAGDVPDGPGPAEHAREPSLPRRQPGSRAATAAQVDPAAANPATLRKIIDRLNRM